MIEEIFKDRWSYHFFRRYVDWSVKTSYTRAQVIGTENIPDPKTNGVIIAPNHCNALMDALVVLMSRKPATLFGARADIFKKKRTADAMHYLKILPMVRVRDGLHNVIKNIETNKVVIDAMDKGMPFCIFPEGRHRTMHSICRLAKGTQRIALQAYETFGDRKPVWIVPAGIEYGDYFRLRSSAVLEYGKPINVTEIVKHQLELHGVDKLSDAGFSPDQDDVRKVTIEQAIMRDLGAAITDGISKCISYLPDDDNYERRWALVEFVSAGFKGKPQEVKRKKQALISKILKMDAERPGEMEALYKDVLKLREKCDKRGISHRSFGPKRLGWLLAAKTLYAIIGVPYYLYSVITTLPMWVTAHIVSGKMTDPTFLNTIHFLIKIAFLPWIFLIWAILAFCFLPWYIAIPALILCIPAYDFIYDTKEFLRRYVSDWRLFTNKKIRKAQHNIVKRFTM